MLCTRILVLVGAILGLMRPVAAQAQTAPVGRWLTQDRKGILEFSRCGTDYCGRLVGIVLDRPGDATPVDRQGRTQCKLTIIRTNAADARVGWTSDITDPRSGTVYRARLKVDDQDRLQVRGFVLLPVLGRTQVWTRFAGALPEDCRLTASPRVG